MATKKERNITTPRKAKFAYAFIGSGIENKIRGGWRHPPKYSPAGKEWHACVEESKDIKIFQRFQVGKINE